MFVSPQAYMMYYRDDIEYFEMEPIKRLYSKNNIKTNIKNNKNNIKTNIKNNKNNIKNIKNTKNTKNNNTKSEPNKLKEYDVKVHNFGNIKLIIEYFT